MKKFTFTPEHPPDVDFFEQWQYEPLPEKFMAELDGPPEWCTKIGRQLRFVFGGRIEIQEI